MRRRRQILVFTGVALLSAIPSGAQTAAPPRSEPAPGAAVRLGSTAPGQTAAAQAPATPGIERLSLPEAEKIAVQNHPQIQIAQHRAASAAAQVQEVQSIYYPQATGNLTGVGA